MGYVILTFMSSNFKVGRDIPVQLRHAVLMEAGYRAVPANFEAELFTAKPTSGLYCCAIR